MSSETYIWELDWLSARLGTGELTHAAEDERIRYLTELWAGLPQKDKNDVLDRLSTQRTLERLGLGGSATPGVTYIRMVYQDELPRTDMAVEVGPVQQEGYLWPERR